jgi:hypothetical protein
MPGYVVDETQTRGTMFGLTNKLILRPTKSEDFLLPRRVIIPQGEVSFRTNGDFITVSVDTGIKEHTSWHEYTIDVDLGCLTNNTSLRTKLYQCYLHAITSHCLPDPLLCHTGTEEALYILQSASCRSFQRLDVHEANLLKLISNLTPERDYYPRHLRSMATVKWNDLPALSQHHDFYRFICFLFDHARALEVLYVHPVAFEVGNRDQLLLSRAASRNKSHYPSDLRYLGEPLSPNDNNYESRDVSDLGAAEHLAFQTSWSIWNDRPSLDCWLPIPNLWDIINSWGSLSPSDGQISPRYSRYWLECIAARDWFVIYDLCREAMHEIATSYPRQSPRKTLTFFSIPMHLFCDISCCQRMIITSVLRGSMASASLRLLSCNVWLTKILKSESYSTSELKCLNFRMRNLHDTGSLFDRMSQPLSLSTTRITSLLSLRMGR